MGERGGGSMSDKPPEGGKKLIQAVRVHKKYEAAYKEPNNCPFSQFDIVELLDTITEHTNFEMAGAGFWRHAVSAQIGNTGKVFLAGDLEKHVKVKFFGEDGTFLLPVECLEKRKWR